MIERKDSTGGAPSAQERMAAFGFGDDVGIPAHPPAVAVGVAQATIRSAKQAATAHDAWVLGQGHPSSLLPSDLIQLTTAKPFAQVAKPGVHGTLGALGGSTQATVGAGAADLPKLKTPAKATSVSKSPAQVVAKPTHFAHAAGQAATRGAGTLGRAGANIRPQPQSRPGVPLPAPRGAAHAAPPIATAPRHAPAKLAHSMEHRVAVRASAAAPQSPSTPTPLASASRAPTTVAPPPPFRGVEVSQEDLRIYSSPDPIVNCRTGYSVDETGAVCIRG
jgi:hypothetical protein